MIITLRIMKDDQALSDVEVSEQQFAERTAALRLLEEGDRLPTFKEVKALVELLDMLLTIQAITDRAR